VAQPIVDIDAAGVEKELVDLTIAISLMNAYNRFAIGFRNTPRAALEN
jgi:alkylhydroperoxidase family enzyme